MLDYRNRVIEDKNRKNERDTSYSSEHSECGLPAVAPCNLVGL
jgi:hypothetical protein